MKRMHPSLTTIRNLSLLFIRWASAIPRSLSKRPLLPASVNNDPRETAPFVDFKRVVCKGGNGGNGMVSFYRGYRVPFGGPDGGDGGNGGHIIFQAHGDVKDLSSLPRFLTARNGEYGRSKSCHGKSAPNLTVKVPLGTVIKSPNSEKILAELTKPESIYLAARGGAGGHGNQFYVSNEVRTPIKAEYGGIGEEVSYDVEMRLMATAALVGFPNAGKSSLLRAITRARPKVASYPFTTLCARVGIVEYDDFVQVSVADIPGLIEGSHKNRGLGISFLKHIQRCHCFFYVLDPTLSNLREQYQALQNEVEFFEESLIRRPHLAVINKCDLIHEEPNLEKISAQFAPIPVLMVSAKYRRGLEELLVYLREEYDRYLEGK
ncbi:hypothetical protein AB6A40_000085 [Gnathostoma spinigerum]|uniref:Mitochondrial ribosome-associated GTPase 2 n=1 Tax=Gnathostoma spinigerum TaxID=75299 RepID=A0ABD6E7M8_9BILA